MRNSYRAVVLATAALLGACSHTRGPEEVTDDGLVRVPSRDSGGVYRDVHADFTRYKRIIVEPPTVEFTPAWRESHPEVEDGDVARMRDEAVRLLLDEIKRELVDRGSYEFADSPGTDVLLLTPRIVDLDIPAPDVGAHTAVRQYSPGPVKLQVAGELRSAESNALLARVVIFEKQARYGIYELRLANRVTNAHEMRLAFGKWSRLVHEALNVAKATRPPPR